MHSWRGFDRNYSWICLNEHRELLEDLTNSCFTKKFSTRKVEEKIGHAYFAGNTFLMIKIYNGFK